MRVIAVVLAAAAALVSVAGLVVLATSGRPPQHTPRVEPVQTVQAAMAAQPVDEDLPLDASSRFVQALTGHRRAVYTGDLEEIQRRHVLRVLVRNNSTSYFLYKGVEAGWDYELALWLAKDLGVRLEMVPVPTRRELVPWLLEGRGDVILAGLSTEAARADRVRFTRPYLETPWVVVTRRDRGPALSDVSGLTGLDLLVRPSSGAMRRLRAMALPGVHLKSATETLESEDLLDEVAEGRAAACVVEERIAHIELMHRHDLQIALVLPGGPDQAAPAVRKEDTALWTRIDAFVQKNRRNTEWNILYKRYHVSETRTAAVRNEALRADREGRLTPWDDTFRQTAASHGVDWRLLAAQAYQESRFDPKARSPMGAVGLMQLLPSTAKELGCRDPFSPRDAISASARYIGKLMKRFDEPEVKLKDRVRFALASYNAGPGHLDDARALARAQGLDANRWFGNVETAMLLLSKPRHYQTARHGFARGEETVRYVSEIQSRYDAYVALTGEP